MTRTYYDYRDGKNTLHESILPEETGEIVNTTDDTRIFYQNPAIWSGIYRREFLIKEKLFFLNTPGASYQDASFNFKVLASGGKLVLTDKAYLHYRRDNETSSVKSTEKLFCVNKEYEEIERYLKEKGKWSTYGYVFEAVKFAAYHWNMLRLDDEDLKKFLLRMRAEFHDADTRGMLRKPYFPKNHWRALRVILDISPNAFIKIFKTYRKKKSRGL